MCWTAGTMHSPCASDIVAAGSSYVCRVRDRTNLNHVVEERPISAAARQAGGLASQVLPLGSSQQRSARPNHPVRIILVHIKPRQPRRKGGRIAGPASDGILRIATNLLDVPAEIIAEIYQHRWTIELFFRFFKHLLGCRHLLSTDSTGIQIQAYCAIIACLLIQLWTGGKPTLRTYEMICFYLQGWAELDEVQAQAREIKNHRIENHRLTARVSTPLITPLDAAHQSSPRTAPHLDDSQAIHPPLASRANHRWPRLHYNSSAEQACIICINASRKKRHKFMSDKRLR